MKAVAKHCKAGSRGCGAALLVSKVAPQIRRMISQTSGTVPEVGEAALQTKRTAQQIRKMILQVIEAVLLI